MAPGLAQALVEAVLSEYRRQLQTIGGHGSWAARFACVLVRVASKFGQPRDSRSPISANLEAEPFSNWLAGQPVA